MFTARSVRAKSFHRQRLPEAGVKTLRNSHRASRNPTGENAMSLRLDGKVAIVTGGAAGIGAATARLLGQLGASVAVLDRDAARATEVVADMQQHAHPAAFYPCNVGSRAAVDEAVRLAEARFGAIHLLVSNAGIQRY